MKEDVLAKFWKITTRVGRVLSESGDCDFATCYLRELVRVVQDHPSLRDEFESAFITILGSKGQYAPLVVIYCMHYLRCPRVKAFAEARLANDPWQLDATARRVVEAYSPDWPLKQVFERTDVEPKTPD